MKKIFILIALLSISFVTARAQEDSLLIAKLLSEVSADSIKNTVDCLSGEIKVNVDGQEQFITTRLFGTDGNALARKYIVQRLESYGLQPLLAENEGDISIYAEKPGSLAADECVIICAHYDNVSRDTGWVHGADDNASGVAAVLEAARLFKDYSTRYSIVYALWDNEEAGLIGSFQFAQDAAQRGIQIRFVVNLDMIGYSGEKGIACNIDIDTLRDNSAIPKLIDKYTQVIPYSMAFYRYGSDHLPFWYSNYRAVMLSEDFTGGMNPNYHSENDVSATLNYTQAAEIARIGYTLLGHYAEISTQMIGSDDKTFDSKPNYRAEVFPNPTRGEFNIFCAPSNEQYTLSLYNQFGELAFAKQDFCSANAVHIQCDISGLADGVYYAKLVTKESVRCFKIVKVK